MSKIKKFAIGTGIVLTLVLGATLFFVLQTPGCMHPLKELRGELVGNSFVITTYDNYGQETMRTSGKRISVSMEKTQDSYIFHKLIRDLNHEKAFVKELKDAIK